MVFIRSNIPLSECREDLSGGLPGSFVTMPLCEEETMIDKNEVIAFFDRRAPMWDAEMVRKEDLIQTILDNGGVRPGADVLDVACGTGVLFPDYLARGANRVVGIDISPNMARIAAGKYPSEQIRVICGDVEETQFPQPFDVVMVYNAFPHFPDPEKLIAALAAATKPGGRLSVAHSMSRARLDRHHSGAASAVSNGLMSEDALAAIFAPWFDVDVKISDDRMYQVSGVRRIGS